MDKVYQDTLKYLGVKKEVDDKTKSAIEECILEVQNAMSFRSIYKVSSVLVENDTIKTQNVTFKSKSLSLHLKNAKKVILYSATLGASVDKILNAYSKINVFKQVIIQAVATAIIENKIDKEQDELSSVFKNYKIKSRFSPGYGDLSLDYQGEILKELNAQKNVGVYLNENNILIPSKSVTAIIGLF